MSSAPLHVEERRYDDPLVASLIEILQADFVVRYGGPDAAVVDPEQFSPPAGVFLVGFDDGGNAAAMGGFRRVGDDAAEIKRMWVAPTARGRGYARAVLAALEERGREMGLARLILNTGPEQPEAIALYESSGYVPVPPFGHYAATPGALFFGREL